MKKEDRRVKKTEKALAEALSKLLVDKKIQNITIRELTETADLHRSTFYTHYTDIYDLYEKLENELSPREKLVLKMRYGLYQGEEYTQREIAAQLGISRSYVSRIEKSAIGKLRQYF